MTDADINKMFFFEDDKKANWQPLIPYTLLRVVNDIFTFYKRIGRSEYRRDIRKVDLHKFNITNYDRCRKD